MSKYLQVLIKVGHAPADTKIYLGGKEIENCVNMSIGLQLANPISGDIRQEVLQVNAECGVVNIPDYFAEKITEMEESNA